jgi:hypothetical protein
MSVLALSMSLGGFIAGASANEAQPVGAEGKRLHDWKSRGETETEAPASQERSFEAVGAVVIGRRTSDPAPQASRASGP